MVDTDRRGYWLGLFTVYLIALGLNEAKLVRPGFIQNPQAEEAAAWWNGRLDLSDRKWDTAFKDGKAYSHFPPMFSFISAAVVPLFGGVPYFMVLLLAAQVPWLAYVLFGRLAKSPVWATVLTLALVCGTSAWPVLERTIRTPAPYFVNQTLAMIGGLIFLIEYLGRRRLWLLGLGLLVAAWSRQLSVALFIPLAFAGWTGSVPAARWKRMAAVCAIGVVAGGVPLMLNALKFRDPFETGYMLIYAADDKNPARTDSMAVDARLHGIFAARYLWRNLYYTNIGLPEIRTTLVNSVGQQHLRGNYMGTGIWWTTPLLIWVFADLRRIVSDKNRLALLAAAVLMYAALMVYHSTGWAQRGYNRYSLDYLPILFTLLLPRCVQGRRRWISLAMIAWSVVYFGLLIRPHVE